MKWSDGEVTVREDGDRITVEIDLPLVAETIGDVLRRSGSCRGHRWLGERLCDAASNVELFHAEDFA